MKIIKSGTAPKFNEVVKFVQDYGGLEYTIKKTKEYCNTALSYISDYTDSQVKDSLVALLDFVSDREN